MIENNRIKLSWAQIAWGIVMLGTIIGSWADTRTQIALLRQEVTLKTLEQERENVRIWKALGEAAASPTPTRKPSH